MSAHEPLAGRRLLGDLTAPGRASFDWAVLCATLALAIPLAGLVGLFFADRSRRKGYPRWKAALAVTIWCIILGVVIRGMLHVGVLP